MRLRTRFALVTLGVILFLIVTPVLVLYARGFKIDWQNRSLVKTGALVVRTEPSRAEIFLNDEKHDSTTPSNIRFLLPGDYNVRIEKEGYQSWTKRLSIKSQLVTWANSEREFITLFYTIPPLRQTLNVTQTSYTPLANELNYLENNQPKSISISDGTIKNLENFPASSQDLTPQQIRESLQNLQLELPDFTNGKIIRTQTQVYLNLDNDLYVVNDGLEKIYAPVTYAFWNNRASTLLFANDHEIYVYNPNTKNIDLILRSITPINNPISSFETGFIFFQNEGKIKAIELDGRDHRNIFTVADALENFILSENGKNLFTFNQNIINFYEIR